MPKYKIFYFEFTGASAMSDFIWFLIISILFMILGMVFVWLGIAIWKKQRMDLIIRHHMEHVSGENRQAYCKLFGIGTIILGIGFVVSGIWMAFTADLLSWIPMTVGLLSGIILIAISVFRYNR